MKIVGLTMQSNKMKEMKEFYTNLLEMPILNEEGQYFTVEAGRTCITFNESEETACYHLAFRTESHNFDEIANKIKREIDLLPDENGQTLMYWKGKQVYFYDPSGNILEILERESPYESQEGIWIDVCEIGIPTNSIEELKCFLEEIPNRTLSSSDTFQFYGDDYGHFVLVKEGRNWYPTEQGATIHPLEIDIDVDIDIEGKQNKVLEHSGFPYTIKIRNCS